MNKTLKNVIKSLSDKQKERLIKMFWEDKVSFKEMKKVFGLAPNQFETVARSLMSEKEFLRWRLRQKKRSTLKSGKYREAND